jgi:Phosphoesterase family
VDTRSAQVVVTFTDLNPVLGNDNTATDLDNLVLGNVNNATDLNRVLANYNNAYADNISFTVGANLPAPPPPTPPVSTVKPLDHVFLIYMENKGVNDIVGSPNAPYINSLINTYGYASDYYALTHPSDPNYTPILGGSDFGINDNCPANCVDAPNLADEIQAAGQTWAGYEEGMPAPGTEVSAPGYTPDELPFFAFRDIVNDPARAQAHLVPLTQLAPDLADSATTPNFAWIAADDATNMEGPTSGSGADQWRRSQLTNHQYHVKAGDEFLQQMLPIIMNSAVWQDPTQKSVIFLTWDEDNNNLSLGIGNQGNHVPMIVIPSPGALPSGMRGGPFVADGYYNHYSLQRTIEDALGLPPLTNNDEYAQPMNQFWT